MPITDVSWVSHDDPSLAKVAQRQTRESALALAVTWHKEAQRYYQLAKSLEAQLRVLAAQHDIHTKNSGSGSGALLALGALVLLSRRR